MFEELLEGLHQAQRTVNGTDIHDGEYIIMDFKTYDKKEIKAIRKKLGLTQKEFAVLLGVSTRTVESWESGQNIPKGSSSRLLELFERRDGIEKVFYSKVNTIEVSQ